MQESSEFHKRSFECAVDSVRATAASHLWQVLTVKYLFLLLCNNICLLFFLPYLQLVVVRADLNGHLKALKDYFLLAKGDFFQVNDQHSDFSCYTFVTWTYYAVECRDPS